MFSPDTLTCRRALPHGLGGRLGREPAPASQPRLRSHCTELMITCAPGAAWARQEPPDGSGSPGLAPGSSPEQCRPGGAARLRRPGQARRLEQACSPARPALVHALSAGQVLRPCRLDAGADAAQTGSRKLDTCVQGCSLLAAIWPRHLPPCRAWWLGAPWCRSDDMSSDLHPCRPVQVLPACAGWASLGWSLPRPARPRLAVAHTSN